MIMKQMPGNASVGDFVEAYVEQGFGSMTKREFEVWAFNEWYSRQKTKPSTYEMSRKLRISQTTVNRLICERDLFFAEADEKAYIADYDKAMRTVEYNPTDKTFSFSIDNTPCRDYVKHVLTTLDCFDKRTVHNTNVVTINAHALAKLHEHFYGKEAFDSLLQEVKTKTDKEVSLEQALVLVPASRPTTDAKGSSIAGKVFDFSLDVLSKTLTSLSAELIKQLILFP